jgi:riboflavin kinase/FMN adenylyltransferase
MTESETILISQAESVGGVLQGGAIALGNFDGVHRGHQAVVKAAVDYARGHEMPARVLTLEPHPRTLFKTVQEPFRLTPASQKIRLLHALGVDDVIVLPFTEQMAALSATAFVEKILLERYGAQHLIAGFDFVFGNKRMGDMQALRSWLAPHQIGVTEVVALRDSAGEIISSSRIRAALKTPDLPSVTNLLGRPFSISGIVVPGAQRGRTLKFPTANIELHDYQRPRFGVYAVNAKRVGDERGLPGIANIGVRPTVDGQTELLEAHLFNFDADLYGEAWEVEFLEFLRPEKKFPDLDALKAQMLEDVAQARALLSCPLAI